MFISDRPRMFITVKKKKDTPFDHIYKFWSGDLLSSGVALFSIVASGKFCVSNSN